jgi:isoquinoline 1-oxidoreductase beta subunit
VALAQQPGKVARNDGNADQALAGPRAFERQYEAPFLAHACMEPMNCTADVRADRCDVYVPTQGQTASHQAAIAASGLAADKVKIHTTYMGGGFGRRGEADFVTEAVETSKAVGKPVKVVWTREDDLRFDYYHASAAVYHKATVDGRGKPTAWLHRSVFQPIASTFAPGAREPMGFELDLGLTDLPYDIPNLRAENGPADAHVRIGWFRAVTNNFHVFASGSFADEMAHAAGRDPLEFLLDMLGPGKVLDLKAQGVDYSNYGAPYDKYPVDTRRLRRVLEIAGEKAGWGKRKAGGGWGMGITAHRSFNTYVASVVEVQTDGRGGFRVPKVHQVVDPGVVINPDRVRAQMEGAAVMGVGMARTGEITAVAGRIQQTNFHQFQVARMNDAPMQVDVHFVESGNLPTGVGEPGVPTVIAALGNAIFAATGKRVRDLPLSRTKL